jgi:hypothetical protein
MLLAHQDCSQCSQCFCFSDHPRKIRVSRACIRTLTLKLTEEHKRPGRIHHCMRSIGAAQAALDLMLIRVTDPSRKAFGKFLYEHGA